MDLHTTTSLQPASGSAESLHWNEIGTWSENDAWLAGGSWLFSEPQVQTHRLIDLMCLGWPPITISDQGVELAATCTFSELYSLAPESEGVSAQPRSVELDPAWDAARLFAPCCRSLRGSFKVWNVATVGGNICTGLPAGPMISLTASLDGIATVWTPTGGSYEIPMLDLVLGRRELALKPGELLRSIKLPAQALRQTPALRQLSLRARGRSAVLLIGLLDPETGAIKLTISAATWRPIRFEFESVPSTSELLQAIDERLQLDDYVEDVHGTPRWRQHLSAIYAEEVRDELAASAQQGLAA